MFGFSDRHKSFLRIANGGKLILGTNITIQQGAVISISQNAIVKLGNNIRINERATLHSKVGITIGDNTRIGFNTQFFDTGFHYLICNGKIAFRNAPIFIDHNVWITNSVSIMKGTYLPAYTVVASNSLCNKNYEAIGEHCLLGGIPAKKIATEVERLLIKESEVDKLFKNTDELLDYEEIKEELFAEKYHKI